jgi:hypothetical protein
VKKVENKSAKDSIAEVLGPILEEIDVIIKEQKFVDPNFSPDIDEKQIGEMNDFEKGLYAWCENFVIWANKIKKAMIETKETPDAKVEKDLTFRMMSLEIIREMIWSSIRNRLDLYSDDAPGLGLRKNFAIVTLPAMESYQEALPRNVTIIELGKGKKGFPGFSPPGGFGGSGLGNVGNC